MNNNNNTNTPRPLPKPPANPSANVPTQSGRPLPPTPTTSQAPQSLRSLPAVPSANPPTSQLRALPPLPVNNNNNGNVNSNTNTSTKRGNVLRKSQQFEKLSIPSFQPGLQSENNNKVSLDNEPGNPQPSINWQKVSSLSRKISNAANPIRGGRGNSQRGRATNNTYRSHRLSELPSSNLQSYAPQLSSENNNKISFDKDKVEAFFFSLDAISSYIKLGRLAHEEDLKRFIFEKKYTLEVWEEGKKLLDFLESHQKEIEEDLNKLISDPSFINCMEKVNACRHVQALFEKNMANLDVLLSSEKMIVAFKKENNSIDDEDLINKNAQKIENLGNKINEKNQFLKDSFKETLVLARDIQGFNEDFFNQLEQEGKGGFPAKTVVGIICDKLMANYLNQAVAYFTVFLEKYSLNGPTLTSKLKIFLRKEQGDSITPSGLMKNLLNKEAVVHLNIEAILYKLNGKLAVEGYDAERFYTALNLYIETYHCPAFDKKITESFLILVHLLVEPLVLIINELKGIKEEEITQKRDMTDGEKNVLKKQFLWFSALTYKYGSAITDHGTCSQYLKMHFTEELFNIGSGILHVLRAKDNIDIKQEIYNIDPRFNGNVTALNLLFLLSQNISKNPELNFHDLALMVRVAQHIGQERVPLSERKEVPVNTCSAIHYSLDISSKPEPQDERQQPLSMNLTSAPQLNQPLIQSLHTSTEILKKSAPTRSSLSASQENISLLRKTATQESLFKKPSAPVGGVAVMPVISQRELRSSVVLNRSHLFQPDSGDSTHASRFKK